MLELFLLIKFEFTFCFVINLVDLIFSFVTTKLQ